MNLRSESLNELGKALALTQMEMEAAGKDSSNPHFKSKFASLESIVACSRPYLSKNGLCVIQRVLSEEGGSFLCTMILHTSGQWIESKAELKPVKSDPQAMGSAITYMRRYCYSSMVGIISEDDDGEKACHRPMETVFIDDEQIKVLRSKLGDDSERERLFLQAFKCRSLKEFPRNLLAEAVRKLDKSNEMKEND
jgi:ERF superfamily